MNDLTTIRQNAFIWAVGGGRLGVRLEGHQLRRVTSSKAEDRRVPAENNLAERDFRPTVIARKVSFGYQSDDGAHTRGVLMTVLCSLKKREVDVATYLKALGVMCLMVFLQRLG